jgi:hypothetical protein
MLKYANMTEELELASQAILTQYLPSRDVKYRVKSISTGEYLTLWKTIDDKNITLGFYSEIVPATPEQVQLEITDYLLLALFGVIIAGIAIILYIKTKTDLDLPFKHKPITTRLEQAGVRNTLSLYTSNLMPNKKGKKPQSPLLIISGVIITVFIGVMIFIQFM